MLQVFARKAKPQMMFLGCLYIYILDEAYSTNRISFNKSPLREPAEVEYSLSLMRSSKYSDILITFYPWPTKIVSVKAIHHTYTSTNGEWWLESSNEAYPEPLVFEMVYRRWATFTTGKEVTKDTPVFLVMIPRSLAHEGRFSPVSSISKSSYRLPCSFSRFQIKPGYVYRPPMIKRHNRKLSTQRRSWIFLWVVRVDGF